MKLFLNIGVAQLGRVILLRTLLWVGLTGCCWGFLESVSSAAEWSIQPSMSMKGYYNSNLLQTPLPHEASYGYWLSPGAEFAGKTERLEVSGKAALDFVDYYGGEPNRFTNIFLPLSVRYRTEKDEMGFTGGFTRDNTLMGELRTTGLVLQFTQRNLWTANPTWTRKLTERVSFQGAFQFSSAAYENGLRLGLVDYQVFGGSLGLIYQPTERNEIQLSWTHANYETTNAPFGLRVSFPGAMMRASHAFTETLKATANFGPRFVHSTTHIGGIEGTNSDTVWVYGADLTQQFERASLQLSLTRDILPSGFGILLRTERVGLLATYNISETLTVSLDTAGYLTSGASPRASGGTISDTRLISSTPGILWKFSEWWSLDASYTYRWFDMDNFPKPAAGHAMMFMLTYYPPKLAFSY